MSPLNFLTRATRLLLLVARVVLFNASYCSTPLLVHCCSGEVTEVPFEGLETYAVLL